MKKLTLSLIALALAACGGSDTPTAAPVISSFTAAPTKVFVGGASTLTWAVTGAVTELAIDQGVGVVTGTSKSVSPTSATTYKLTAKNAAGSATSSVTVNVTKFDSASAINTYLEGKSMVMTGADIPTHPNGFNENTNYGASTQCYNKTTIAVASGTWNVTTLVGTLNGAPTVGSTGTCDRATIKGSPLAFSSTTVAIANVQGNGTCFDVDVDYGSFQQRGRGAITADGAKLTMELFFGNQALKSRCADGVPGTTGVVLNGVAFTGNAVQTYRIQ